MHSCKVGWAGQAFALATSSDAGGRKSRIRRSKEERKSMIESFIHKYQISNEGNFPSLNLTHKEVGGSFYTVREIVREIIQENRVLAPPKVSSEEHSLSEFLEQHPLGSISMDPLIDLSVSSSADVATHVVHENNQCSSAVSYPSGLYGEQTDVGSDGTSESHHVPNHYQDKTTEEVSNSPQPESLEFEESVVNGFEVVYGSPYSDKSLITGADHYDVIDSGSGSRALSNEHQTVDKAKEFEQRIYTQPQAEETQGRVKLEARNVETSPAIKYHTISDVVVETFPLRPVPRTTNNMSEDSGKRQVAAETSDDCEKKLPHSTVEPSLQVPVMENREDPSASKPSVLVLDNADVPELQTLPDRAKAGSCSTVGRKSGDGDNSKGNNPTLDRINLETWDDGAAKKPETNPFLALVKAIISSFVKLWTE